MKIGTLFELGVIGAISLNYRDFYEAASPLEKRFFPQKQDWNFVSRSHCIFN
ncbi:MAG TPA: hypothetical protein VK850_05390 [Candidatus Binatia bacterium]|nr:hypothetical protein [Candidatus Binatia bacterium]